VASGECGVGRKFGREKPDRKDLWLERCDPGCFSQEWQTKGLWVTRRVRVANTGLKVVMFSWSCVVSVRVARKGLRGGIFLKKGRILVRVAAKGLKRRQWKFGC